VVLFLVGLGHLAGAEDQLPRTFFFNPKTLADHRAAYRGGDKRYETALESMRTEAEKALRLQPLSVTQKPYAAPSGDKHDYLSQAPYFWPNPARHDGLPYARSKVHAAKRKEFPRRARTC
jgi:hypothetical protein